MNHRTGTREEWLRARLELLKSEKELTRLNDDLARLRRELPWVRIDKDYLFDTEQARGLDALWPMWQWLDRAPLGRNEDDPSWLRRHDDY